MWYSDPVCDGLFEFTDYYIPGSTEQKAKLTVGDRLKITKFVKWSTNDISNRVTERVRSEFHIEKYMNMDLVVYGILSTDCDKDANALPTLSNISVVKVSPIKHRLQLKEQEYSLIKEQKYNLTKNEL